MVECGQNYLALLKLCFVFLLLLRVLNNQGVSEASNTTLA